MNVVLICSGGLSAAIMMKKLKMEAKEQGLPLRIEAMGLQEIGKAVHCDVLLLSPQCAYAKGSIEKQIDAQTSIVTVHNYDYASLNAKKVLAEIQREIQEKTS